MRQGTAEGYADRKEAPQSRQNLAPSGFGVPHSAQTGGSGGRVSWAGSGFWGDANQSVQGDVEAFVLEMNAAR